jgi:uncharacterized protein YbjT (DUF2867 family)
MNILFTGSTGYIGKRLLEQLLDRGHTAHCFVRNSNRYSTTPVTKGTFHSYKVDLLQPIPEEYETLEIDVAFYLVHSMSSSINTFMDEEDLSARNFAAYIRKTNCRQVIYLSGISNSEKLSKHLASRLHVEEVLRSSGVPITILRAGIIVGSGSASFEIIRDLMEKLPILVAPTWVLTRCQPVGIRDVLNYLTGCMLHEATFNETFDIGGPEVLTYKEMLMQYAAVRGFRRYILVLPFINPRISSYWLYFITSTSYKLAVNLVNSMKVEVVCKDNRLREMLNLRPVTYRKAVELALRRINLDAVTSSWTDAVSFSRMNGNLFDFLEVPTHGTLKDHRVFPFSTDPQIILDRFFSIGGERGWYYGNMLWKIRGFIDKLAGGVGLRRGRRSATELNPGDALDFWRVLVADREGMRLLLFAEMKVPGDAWLEFKITNDDEGYSLHQTATFMPYGISGRLYWYLLLPVHIFMFKGMIYHLVHFKSRKS